MIFRPISQCEDKTFLEELILVYSRIAESCAEIADTIIEPVSSCTTTIGEELRRIGIAKSAKDIKDLECNFDKPLINRFYSAISFALSNPSFIGNSLDRLSNEKRKIAQRNSLRSGKPTVADFFAGAGGMSSGFSAAGYRICFANDIQEVCINTYRYNHPEIPAKSVSTEDVRTVVKHIADFVPEPVDVVIGGPPCQGFSSANKQPIIDDPRNELYKYYVQAVKQLLPKFVVMENVRGMSPVANQVVADFSSISAVLNGRTVTYKTSFQLLNSQDFGVSQSRERLIFLSIRSDVCERKQLSPQCLFEEIKASFRKGNPFVLDDALAFIRPLEAPRVKHQNEVDSEIWGRTIEPNRFQGNENAYLRSINNNRQIPILFNHRARYLSNVNYEIYRTLNQGDDATDPKIAAIMPYAHRNHCFKDKYYKLRADRPCRTITAHLKMDCHSHIHPHQTRALTPREAARCQSFPDDYLFLGAYLKTYMQIGNAVPVLMAKGIAGVIKKHLP